MYGSLGLLVNESITAEDIIAVGVIGKSTTAGGGIGKSVTATGVIALGVVGESATVSSIIGNSVTATGSLLCISLERVPLKVVLLVRLLLLQVLLL